MHLDETLQAWHHVHRGRFPCPPASHLRAEGVLHHLAPSSILTPRRRPLSPSPAWHIRWQQARHLVCLQGLHLAPHRHHIVDARLKAHLRRRAGGRGKAHGSREANRRGQSGVRGGAGRWSHNAGHVRGKGRGVRVWGKGNPWGITPHNSALLPQWVRLKGLGEGRNEPQG